MQKFYEKMGEERVLFALQLEEMGHLTNNPLSTLDNLQLERFYKGGHEM